MRRSRRAALCCALAVAAASIPVVAATSRDAAAADPTTWTFGFTGDPQTFTVPADVTELSMVVVGAAGGPAGTFAANPGTSGAATGTTAVTPGEVLTVWVGGAGETGGTGGGPPADGGWGFGCGGQGGQATNPIASNGNGGGGASAVTSQDAAPDPTCGNRPSGNDVRAVAGGGGGGGGDVVVPAEVGFASQLVPGGRGGTAGPSPSPGGGGAGGTADGGCGGCAAGIDGTPGADNTADGAGAGGGGGGSEAGEGGASGDSFFGGGGGGGGRSAAGALLSDAGFFPGTGGGDGMVTLAAGTSATFPCEGGPDGLVAPSGSGWLSIVAQGGHGATRGSGRGAAGGAAGLVDATVGVEGGDDVTVFTGCAGDDRQGGVGYAFGGNGGRAPDPTPFSGAGGGGASGVAVDDRLMVVAGGGGGGGGKGGGGGMGGNAGGAGGAGGNPPTAGAHGLLIHGHSGGDGGCGGCGPDPGGRFGGSSARASEGGGGGGGGGGWYGGGGGSPGRFGTTLVGGGGGGGGGGLSHVVAAAIDVATGTSTLDGDGSIDLLFMPDSLNAISTYGGSSQQTTIGAAYSATLAALVTDATGRPVEGVPVLFVLPGGGPSGTFPGGTLGSSATTGPTGFATSAPITANLLAGGWEARALVTGIADPAEFALRNLPVGTATHVTASPDPATPTEDVTFTATVTAATAAASPPLGQVQFQVDGTDLGGPVALTNGNATSAPTTGLTVGDHEVTATFTGNDPYLGSVGSMTLPVVATPTATAVTSSINPSIETEAITFTATISVPPGNTAYSGTVQFQIDGVDFGAPAAAAGGTATSGSIDTLTIADSPYVITAVTAPTAQYAGSTGSMHQVVDPDGTAVNVTSSVNPAQYGVPLTLDATVVPRPGGSLTPTGSVAFTVDGGTGCAGALTPATPPPPDAAATSCALPSPPMPLAPGPHDVLGSYGGDGDFDPSLGSMVQVVTQAHTTTTITSDPAGGSIYGQDVTFTATVERVVAGSGTPTGTVQFTFDGDPLGAPVPVTGGPATSPVVTPDVGVAVVRAVYSGDTNFFGSTGVDAHPVEPAPTTITLAAEPEPSHVGDPVTFVADVTAQVSGASPVPIPTGTVQFRVDGHDHGAPVTLVNGRATVAAPNGFEHGIHHVTATYESDTGDFLGSHVAIAHDVREDSVTVVASSENPAPTGGPVTFRAHVGPKAGEGTVAFSVDGTPVDACQAVPVVESEAACDYTFPAASTHQVVAVFSGAPTLDPSEGLLLQEIVGAPAPTFTG